ncbi:hypothetical protein MED121_14050 [Marinomonas sp. MED121]|uniref:CGNR zinc finger domain-containing protein n=1 Tax=Marinomonas sp. MED121 TaxID=314277 RepID=UPI000068FED2|nr:CGNR zinc finger domain-containing protein [Marinomonas sp. MED121]EAQ67056.1 hypothetical protein MED121_14050 [Marinomonas sp. MED121]
MLDTQNSFIGGHPILDFINTVEDQDKNRFKSQIGDWQSLLSWIGASPFFNAHHKMVLAGYDEAKANALLVELHTIREALYIMFKDLLSNSSNNEIPNQIESSIQAALSQASLLRQENQYQWQLDTSKANWLINTFYLLLDDFLRTQDLSKLRECGRCTWLFLNSGRGRGRRWCRMNTCGNREKSDYFRKRQTKTDE